MGEGIIIVRLSHPAHMRIIVSAKLFTDEFLNDHSHFLLINAVIDGIDIATGNVGKNRSKHQLDGIGKLLQSDFEVGMAVG